MCFSSPLQAELLRFSVFPGFQASKTEETKLEAEEKAEEKKRETLDEEFDKVRSARIG